LPITAPLGDCTVQRTLLPNRSYKQIEMHVEDAIGTEQNVMLQAN